MFYNIENNKKCIVFQYVQIDMFSKKFLSENEYEQVGIRGISFVYDDKEISIINDQYDKVSNTFEGTRQWMQNMIDDLNLKINVIHYGSGMYVLKSIDNKKFKNSENIIIYSHDKQMTSAYHFSYTGEDYYRKYIKQQKNHNAPQELPKFGDVFKTITIDGPIETRHGNFSINNSSLTKPNPLSIYSNSNKNVICNFIEIPSGMIEDNITVKFSQIKADTNDDLIITSTITFYRMAARNSPLDEVSSDEFNLLFEKTDNQKIYPETELNALSLSCQIPKNTTHISMCIKVHNNTSAAIPLININGSWEIEKNTPKNNVYSYNVQNINEKIDDPYLISTQWGDFHTNMTILYSNTVKSSNAILIKSTNNNICNFIIDRFNEILNHNPDIVSVSYYMGMASSINKSEDQCISFIAPFLEKALINSRDSGPGMADKVLTCTEAHEQKKSSLPCHQSTVTIKESYSQITYGLGMSCLISGKNKKEPSDHQIIISKNRTSLFLDNLIKRSINIFGMPPELTDVYYYLGARQSIGHSKVNTLIEVDMNNKVLKYKGRVIGLYDYSGNRIPIPFKQDLL